MSRAVKDIVKSLESAPFDWKLTKFTLDHKCSGLSIWISNGSGHYDLFAPESISFGFFDRRRFARAFRKWKKVTGNIDSSKKRESTLHEVVAKSLESKKDTMKFITYEYADISTGYLSAQDLILIGNKNCPMHIAEEDEERGSFFYVPTADVLSERSAEARTYGLSERFIEIIEELSKQGIPYVRFDADGGSVEGLDPL